MSFGLLPICNIMYRRNQVKTKLVLHNSSVLGRYLYESAFSVFKVLSLFYYNTHILMIFFTIRQSRLAFKFFVLVNGDSNNNLTYSKNL